MDGQAYFDLAVSYDHKMFMKFTTGVNVITLSSALQYSKLECLLVRNILSDVFYF
jgi:hypothetical protein